MDWAVIWNRVSLCALPGSREGDTNQRVTSLWEATSQFWGEQEEEPGTGMNLPMTGEGLSSWISQICNTRSTAGGNPSPLWQGDLGMVMGSFLLHWTFPCPEGKRNCLFEAF